MTAEPQGPLAPPQPVSFLSGIHRLDARLHGPAGRVEGAIVVAHPHPAHGGAMDHAVVVATAACAAAMGLTALRFDFGGVGRSEGDRTDFPQHLEDWRAAVLDLRRRVPDGPLLGAGFSYGARTLAAVLAPGSERPPAVAALLLLAPATRVPTSRRDFGNLLLGRPLSEAARDADVLANLRALTLPVEVLVGSADVVAPPDELREHLPPHARLSVLAGLNHFFSRGPGAGPLATDVFVPALDAALRRLLRAQPPA